MIQDRINERSPWQDITEGNKIYEPATSREFNTGEWRTATPIFDKEKCRQCLLCALKNGDVTLHTFSELRARSASRSGTDPALAARVRAIVARELGVDEAQIRDDSHIVNELGADSLSYLSLLGAIDAEFGLPAPVGEETRCTTVAEFCDYIERNIL